MKEVTVKKIQVRLVSADNTWLADAAKKNGKTVSEVIRELIRKEAQAGRFSTPRMS